MKTSLTWVFGALTALVSAIPSSSVPVHERANFTLGNPILPHHKRSQGTTTYADFAGVDWHDGYNNIYAVSGEVIVPQLHWRSGGPASQVIAIWIGIDSTNCGSSSLQLIQTGIIGQVYSDGSTYWYAFQEWAGTDVEQKFNNFAVHTGDDLTFQVLLNSGGTTGTANVVNKSTGQKVSANISGAQVCASDAQWIIEDIGATNNFANYALADFSTFYMTNALAIADGQYFNAADGEELTMARNGQTYVTVGDSNSNIIFVYDGPK